MREFRLQKKYSNLYNTNTIPILKKIKSQKVVHKLHVHHDSCAFFSSSFNLCIVGVDFVSYFITDH